MKDTCFGKLLEKDAFLDDLFRTRLTLLCCNVCKKLESEEKFSQSEELFVMPLFFSMRRNEDRLMISIGCALLERIAKKFGNADEKKVQDFLINLAEISKGKKRYSHEWLNDISEGTYCKILGYLYWMKCYDLMYMIAMQYIFNMTEVQGSSARSNWYYKRDNDKPFFQIGIALDEGIVQTITMEVLNSGELIKESNRTKSLSSLSDAYYFEMKYVDKIIDTFKCPTAHCGRY